ncbi:MAG: hypothetical protein NWR72_10400 [Bacteroidia bacterium]|nr:hypothetical protein [Bacteroidia bacterium]
MVRPYLLISVLVFITLFAMQCTVRPSQFVSLTEPVAYAGREACQSCHQKIYTDFVETGMGKSLYRPDPRSAIERFDAGQWVADPVENFLYRAFWENGDMYVEECRVANADTVYRRREKVDYVVGSGHQTRSYLMERDGWIYEMPITWYVDKQLWDLSPGYDVNNSRFDREIGEACLACHTGQIDFVAHSKNRFRAVSLGIDCESCHGPGQAHIDAINGGQLIDVGREIDYTIVNPAKLPISLQFDVCQQCHLQGINVYEPGKSATSFRPGERLDQAWTVFLADSGRQDQFGIASHAERLQQSRCFIASDDLTCTTCHDPHKAVELSKPDYYTATCEACHSGTKAMVCGIDEESQTGDCVSCHMPSGGTSDIPHVSFHDHKIRVVRPSESDNIAAVSDYLRLLPGNGTAATDADFGKAWRYYFEQHQANPAYLDSASSYASQDDYIEQARLAMLRQDMAAAERAIEAGLGKSPGNTALFFLQGEWLEANGEPGKAAIVFEELTRRHPDMLEAEFRHYVNLFKSAPDDHSTLARCAAGFESLRQRRPFDKRMHTNLAFIRIRQNQLPEAERLLVQALALDPDDAKALENMILLHSIRGNKILLNQYLERLETAHPDHPGLTQIRDRTR